MSPDGNLAMSEGKANWRRGFWSLIATQFQGAFNENALKFLAIYLILALEKDKAQREGPQQVGSVAVVNPRYFRRSAFLHSAFLSGLHTSAWRCLRSTLGPRLFLTGTRLTLPVNSVRLPISTVC